SRRLLSFLFCLVHLPFFFSLPSPSTFFTLSLHDALPILTSASTSNPAASPPSWAPRARGSRPSCMCWPDSTASTPVRSSCAARRSEERRVGKESRYGWGRGAEKRKRERQVVHSHEETGMT